VLNVPVAMHSTIPSMTLQASTEASLRFPITATSLLSHQLISPSGCQISPSTARLQWGESDISSERPVLKSSIQTCDFGRSVSNGARMCQSSTRTSNLRTRSIAPGRQSSAAVGILDRSEPWEGNADHQCTLHPSTEVDMQDLTEGPPGEAPTEHEDAHPAEVFRQTSPSSKTPVPSSQVQNHVEDSRPGPATASPNPGQELHPVLASLAPDSFAAPSEPPSLLVFSGGTAFNGVVEDLKHFTTRVSHVLPVSDDGGSTAEIVRVLGKELQLVDSTSHSSESLSTVLMKNTCLVGIFLYMRGTNISLTGPCRESESFRRVHGLAIRRSASAWGSSYWTRSCNHLGIILSGATN
jgi:hypothetical protein